MERVTVGIKLTIKGRNGDNVTYDDSMVVVEQICNDALRGTFGDIPTIPAQPWTLAEERESLVFEPVASDEAQVSFSLVLPGSCLPPREWILQHLTGILAGDLIPSAVGEHIVTRKSITQIEVGAELESSLQTAFRMDVANDIAAIRQRFRLEPGMPLMSYAFKPRMGLTFTQTRDLVLSVLRAGFNYVVLDTRNSDVNASTLDPWLDLVAEAASLGLPHVTAFSPNLSMPVLDLLPIVEKVLNKYPEGSVPALKIDGGLDGISAVQAVRRRFRQHGNPVISCYPLLRSSLQPYLPGDAYVKFLALSGVDIIYPGGRPLLPHERRPIWAEEAAAIKRSVETYHRTIHAGWPMPLLAGGLHPGQLHVLYELFGPDTGLFLGGAVALHRGGPGRGARLCVDLIKEAAKIARKAAEERRVADEILNGHLIREIENAYEDIEYLPPMRVLPAKARLPRWYQWK